MPVSKLLSRVLVFTFIAGSATVGTTASAWFGDYSWKPNATQSEVVLEVGYRNPSEYGDRTGTDVRFRFTNRRATCAIVGLDFKYHTCRDQTQVRSTSEAVGRVEAGKQLRSLADTNVCSGHGGVHHTDPVAFTIKDCP